MTTSKENLHETPFQTAGPFLHIGCMPNAIKIEKLYQNDLGEIPFKNKNESELITIEGSVFDGNGIALDDVMLETCLLYTSPSPRDGLLSRMPSSA